MLVVAKASFSEFILRGAGARTPGWQNLNLSAVAGISHSPLKVTIRYLDRCSERLFTRKVGRVFTARSCSLYNNRIIHISFINMTCNPVLIDLLGWCSGLWRLVSKQFKVSFQTERCWILWFPVDVGWVRFTYLTDWNSWRTITVKTGRVLAERNYSLC